MINMSGYLLLWLLPSVVSLAVMLFSINWIIALIFIFSFDFVFVIVAFRITAHLNYEWSPSDEERTCIDLFAFGLLLYSRLLFFKE